MKSYSTKKGYKFLVLLCTGIAFLNLSAAVAVESIRGQTLIKIGTLPIFFLPFITLLKYLLLARRNVITINYPHHITQRGSNWRNIFLKIKTIFQEGDINR